MNEERVVVAMSGGVDSSSAALIMKLRGYNVIGITMQLWDYSQMQAEKFGTCCSPQDVADARRVAEAIGIPFYVVNLQEEFYREVVEYFIDEYTNARTPNPCIVCNARMKFHHLLHIAKQLGAKKVATGHYARVGYDEVSGRYFLRRGLYRNKDQSYFLFSLKQEQLEYALFPLGEYTKGEARCLSRSFGLRVADKKGSQEICFIPDGHYSSFIQASEHNGSFSPGLIVNSRGGFLGYHKGLPFYTIGQRKGLGISTGKPLYVTGIDLKNNILVVGEALEVRGCRFLVREVNWMIKPPEFNENLEASVQIRHKHPGGRARLQVLDHNEVKVEFWQPQWAITPGQAAVFYENDRLLGGGWIAQGW